MSQPRIVRSLATVLTAMCAAAVVAPLHAQVTITPLIGGYVPAGNINDVSGGAQTVANTRDGTLSLGLNLELGALRGSVAYASGTTIKNANNQDIGKGNVLGAAADLVIRPLPRIFVQPYLIAGAGQKFYKYDQSSSLATGGDARRFALHGGVGADLMFGAMGVAAELTDFVSKNTDDKWSSHDAFLMVGVKLNLGR